MSLERRQVSKGRVSALALELRRNRIGAKVAGGCERLSGGEA